MSSRYRVLSLLAPPWTQANFADIRDAVRKYNGSIFGAVVRSVASKSLSVPIEVSSVKLADTRWVPDEPLVSRKQECFVAYQSDSNLCAYRGSGPESNRGGLWCARRMMVPPTVRSTYPGGITTFAVLNASVNRMQVWAQGERYSAPLVQSRRLCPGGARPLSVRVAGLHCKLSVWCKTWAGRLVKVQFAGPRAGKQHGGQGAGKGWRV